MRANPNGYGEQRQTTLRQRAIERLNQALDDAEVSELHAKVGVEVTLEAGRITLVRRKFEATEK